MLLFRRKMRERWEQNGRVAARQMLRLYRDVIGRGAKISESIAQFHRSV
jgi:hypothetical protein